MQKTAIITGGTKGIGKSLVEEFVLLGYAVFTCARNKVDIRNLEKEYSARDSNVQGMSADLSKKENCKAFIEFVLERTDKIDCMVNNAGIFQPGKIHEEDDSIFEMMMKINLDSAYYITKGFVPLMKKNRSGHIFNMCSTASIIPYSNGGAYCISKFALLGFSKVLREELKEYNIKVTSVLPGATFTPSWKGSELPESRFMKASDVSKTIIAALQLSNQAVVEELIIRPQLGDI
jgi:short-subunit dehydrogenase